MSSASLPSAPSLEQLRKQAKELLRAHRAGDPRRVARVAAHAPGEPLKLTGAQHVVAREHGFPSWPRLKAYVERVAAHGPDSQHAFHEDLDYYEGRADGLLASAQDSTEGAVAAFERWGAPLTEAGARTVVARQHGFATGPRCAATSPACARRASRSRAPTAPSRPTTSTACASSSSASPTSSARGTNGNDLLGMAGATCDERLVRVLLDARRRPGARQRPRLDAAAPGGLLATCRCWRRCCSTRARRSTSRPAATAARRSSSRCSGATGRWPSCWPTRGVHPRNLRAAAGLGRLDLIEELVAPDGRSRPRPARTAPSTARTAAFRTGAGRTTRGRSSTRRCPGRRAATAWTCSSRWSPAAPTSTPTSTAAAR